MRSAPLAARAEAPRRFRRLLPLVPLLFLLAGCAGPQPLLKKTKAGPQWPEQPYAPQVEWVKNVSSPEDAGIRKGFWKKALEIITGPELHQIVKPYGVLFDEAGRLFIADPGAGLVHLMDTKEGRYTCITGENGALFASPIGLAEDGAGRLYITDSGANTVYRYDIASGTLTPFLRQVERPTGIAYHKGKKFLYISETTAHRIIAVDEKGTVRMSFGDRPRPGQTPLNMPTDIAIDHKGRVYVNDPLNYKIRIFTAEGAQVGQFGAMGDARGELNKPKGIAVDGDGHVYVADALLDAVQIFDENGQFLFSFGGTGTDDGAFWMPSGLFILGNHIFVADTYNQRVQLFRRIGGEGEDPKSSAEKVQIGTR